MDDALAALASGFRYRKPRSAEVGTIKRGFGSGMSPVAKARRVVTVTLFLSPLHHRGVGADLLVERHAETTWLGVTLATERGGLAGAIRTTTPIYASGKKEGDVVNVEQTLHVALAGPYHAVVSRSMCPSSDVRRSLNRPAG